LRHQIVSPRESKQRALDLLTELGMGHRAKGLPATLSGGEQQRVAIARALITNPSLILADEPTGALDPITSREVLALFKKLHEEKGVSFLIVTHSAEVAAFCDRSLELRDGRFVAQHGEDLEVTDLATSRELIVDDIGTVAFPPDILLQMGGSGRYEVEEVGDGRLVLVSAEQEESLIVGGKTLATSCPACNHKYGDDKTQLCPDCGSSRPMV
jgi:ABC-type multidrug transport system ATPase subunit